MQSDIQSDTNATTKFGEEQVETCLPLHKKAATIAETIVEAKKDGTKKKDSSKAYTKRTALHQ